MNLSIFWVFTLIACWVPIDSYDAEDEGKEFGVPEIEIYYVKSTVSFPYGLDSNGVKQQSIRVISIRKPSMDASYVEWLQLPSKKYDQISMPPGDMRVLFIIGKDNYAFSPDGESGIVNNKSVIYSKMVQNWYKKHLDAYIR